LAELRERFESAALAHAPIEGAGDGANKSYLWLQPNEDPARVLADLALLEPFGTTNPAPDLAIQARVLSAREVTGGHLKLELERERGRRLSAFAPTLGHRAADLGERVAAAGKLRKDTYRGGDAVELKVDRFL
jgi:single-stranded-DNA-specific exonuclease